MDYFFFFLNLIDFVTSVFEQLSFKKFQKSCIRILLSFKQAIGMAVK